MRLSAEIRVKIYAQGIRDAAHEGDLDLLDAFWSFSEDWDLLWHEYMRSAGSIVPINAVADCLCLRLVSHQTKHEFDHELHNSARFGADGG